MALNSNSNLNNPYFNYTPYPMEEDEIDLREIFSTIWRNKWIVILTFLLSIGGAGIYLYLTPPSYKTSATLEVTSSTKPPLGRSGDILTQAMEIYTYPTDIDTEIAILQSRSMIEKTLSQVDFTHRYYQIQNLKRVEILPSQAPI
jgi:uncharacterized protein involved in exopolysaccharide biosynthesis